ncbi:MAG TPA: DUF2865 domain-containing protein [Xanthobacteraceae bacterium]|nr:DUF2865 domain-containing protein [Xanthobacteraceae bacterium]
MGISRQKSRPLAVAGLALVVCLLGTATVSAGSLDNLFSDHRQDSSAALPYAPTSTRSSAFAQPQQPAFAAIPAVSSVPAVTAVPSVGIGSVTYCVRLCDGRYFPMQRHAGASPIQMCSAFCPAAKTKVFSGSPIDHAAASDGQRYADIDNAFVYRQKIVPGCTCNGRDSFGLAPIDLASDTTLRAGDIVATRSGFAMFTGSQAQLHKGAGFTPVRLDQTAAAAEPRRIAATRD